MALIQLTSSDGFQFDCWTSPASTTRSGAVVVLQEIFGVNHHIQAVCDRLASEGFDAYAPALFDRLQPRFSSGYRAPEITEALQFLPKLNWDDMVQDTLATLRHARVMGDPVAVMGFCLGASVGYMAAQRDPGFAAVVGYYGGHIANHLDAPLKARPCCITARPITPFPCRMLRGFKPSAPNAMCMFMRQATVSIAMNARHSSRFRPIWPGRDPCNGWPCTCAEG